MIWKKCGRKKSGLVKSIIAPKGLGKKTKNFNTAYARAKV
jgi:hypothetical protein